ncbi:hypothetical protein [Algibacillus agarilyticus]|uniref:hypothetical protein n=1 Tax=Algibacillus agarilyticus TaxID=2234133 RepID=UPI000DCF78ED|nr:hypothetical protein [Algibacillus agarilyticus]
MNIPINQIKTVCQYLNQPVNYDRFISELNNKKKLINKQKAESYNGTRLIAIYDFAELPYTSDIAVFIINAEVERRRLGLHKIDIILVTDEVYPANPHYESRINQSNYKQLIHNLALEYTKLFDFIGSVLLLDNRNQAITVIKALEKTNVLFPIDYNPSQPFERQLGLVRPLSYQVLSFTHFSEQDLSYNCLKAPNGQVQLARRWLKKYAKPRIPITITLRETTIDSSRNSNISAWQALVTSYEKQDEFIFIILTDFYSLYDADAITGKNVIYCNEAVGNLAFRAALHQEATLNLFVSNGVNVVSIFSNKTAYINFKIITDDAFVASADFLEKTNRLTLGDNWHGATKYQKYVWQEDSFEILKQETDHMLNLLKEDNKLVPNFYKPNYQDQPDPQNSCSTLTSQKSLISERVSLNVILGVYSFFKVYKWIRKYLYVNILGIYPYADLNDIKIRKGTRLAFYGAGSITRDILPAYIKNTECIFDNKNELNRTLNGIRVLHSDSIHNIDFDYLVVTPKYREVQIIEELQEKFSVDKTKFVVVNKSVFY